VKREMAWMAVPVALSLCAVPCLALSRNDLALIAPAAESGAASSQVLLAVAWLNGDGGLSQDPARAVYWFEQAAMQGSTYAEEKLGDLYQQGLGVPANLKLAFDWRMKAARRGSTRAQVEVGRMYQQGDGVAKDVDLAIHWFHRAATEGNADAQLLLERIYHYGDDAEVQRAASRSWFERAAQKAYEGLVVAMNLIEGIGYQVDEAWHRRPPGLKQLADDGDLEAEFQLAKRYEHGVGGVQRNPGAALSWYQRAAARGHLMAMRALAQIYSDGLDGVQRDPDVAAAWAERLKAAVR
jgi:uncharacterized protein